MLQYTPTYQRRRRRWSAIPLSARHRSIYPPHHPRHLGSASATGEQSSPGLPNIVSIVLIGRQASYYVSRGMPTTTHSSTRRRRPPRSEQRQHQQPVDAPKMNTTNHENDEPTYVEDMPLPTVAPIHETTGGPTCSAAIIKPKAKC